MIVAMTTERKKSAGSEFEGLTAIYTCERTRVESIYAASTERAAQLREAVEDAEQTIERSRRLLPEP